MDRRAPDENRENPARPLKDVYSVALGVALVLAVEQIVDTEKEGAPFAFGLFPSFLGFVFTAFALYHWAVRVVDISYIEHARSRPRLAIVTDLLVGSTELLLLIALSILISRPSAFLVALTGLLGFEVLAGAAFTRSRGYAGFERFATRYWQVNLAGFAAGVVGIVLLETVWPSDGDIAGWITLALGLARTSAVYGVGFDFLFYGAGAGNDVPPTTG